MGEAVELGADLADLADDAAPRCSPRRFDGWFMNVRLVWTSKRRVPENGIWLFSTWPSSMTSPVLMSRAARSTLPASCG